LPRSDPDDAAVIIYTSGTTGTPKGCMLSHRAWTNNARFSMQRAGIGEGATVFSPSPFFHLFGSLSGLMGAMSVGASFSTCDVFRADECATAIHDQGVVHLVAVPTVWLDLMATVDPGDLPSLSGGFWGGGPFPRPQLERALARDGFGWNMQAVYGMTEAPTLTQVAPEDPELAKLETVGRATAGVELRIVDPATQTVVDTLSKGEIQARGYNRMLGYLGKPEATAERFDGDWIRTGDVGYLDEHGFLRVTGRITDMIVTGGANVYAREVEDVLSGAPGVMLAVVVAADDERLGEVPVAWVQRVAGGSVDEQALAAHCRQRLAKYKVPRRFLIVDELPLTAGGKVHRAELRERTRGLAAEERRPT
jgi:fatty-acyl-CoA synthase